MNTTISSENNYLKINRLIITSRFNEAFLLLKRGIGKYPNIRKELDKLQALESTYKYLLDYVLDGNIDPSRNEMIEQIRDALNRANDILRREERLTDSSDIYSSTRRLEVLRNNTLASHIDNFKSVYKEDLERNQKISPLQSKAMDDIFKYIWTLGYPSSDDISSLNEAFDNPEIPYYLKALMVSAITLGGLEYFDENSFEILLNQYEIAEFPIVRARALVGVLLISLLHSGRLHGNIKLRTRLLLDIGDDLRKEKINEALLSIIRTYDTKRIDSKMRNEVIPGLMKIQPEILDKMRNLASDSEDFLSEENPNWEDFLESSEIGEKLREINDLQMEGADVMVTAFSNLKSFPFFNQISNWFLPFLPSFYQFGNIEIENEQEMIDRLTTVMCDSDLNSFLLSIGTMPEDKRTQMFNNLQNQMKEAQQAFSNGIENRETVTLSKKIRHTLQDLYRFFKYFRKKNDFYDPFGTPFLATHIKPLLPLLGIEAENVKLVAEFYFKNKYYEEAAGMFELVDNLMPGDFSTWEKIGFCLDKCGDYKGALTWYRKAELVNPDNSWLTKKIAVTLKNSGQPAEALDYFKKALEVEPENFHLIMSMAQCLIDCGKADEALNYLHHARYLKPDKISVERALAWTELLSGNFEKALALYDTLLQNPKADRIDYLNAAHASLAAGDMKRALSLYKSFVDKTEKHDITQLVMAFRDDNDTLKKLKIQTSDLRLIIDKIRYDYMQ